MPNAFPLLVTAHLASPLAGDPPQLDALLEWAISLHHGLAVPEHRSKVDRRFPAPPQGELPVPLGSAQIGRWLVYQCSAPVLPTCRETVEHINKRLAVECAGLLDPGERKVVSTTNSWTKSYRLPLRVRAVSCVRWTAVGVRRNVRMALRSVQAIGKKVADGYGRVSGWEVERATEDWSWFAPHPGGTLLMRVLPAGPWLPKDLVGWRADFCGVAPPLWHPDRWAEAVVPC